MDYREKMVVISNTVYKDLNEMMENALQFNPTINSDNISYFENFFFERYNYKEHGISRKLLREKIVEYILKEYGSKVFGV